MTERDQLVAACDTARAEWRKAPFSLAPLAYTRYLEACTKLYEYDHPATETADATPH